MTLPTDPPFTDLIALEDLPRWSPWPERLLGLSEWKTVPRTVQKLEQEYDREKFASCLAYVHDHPSASIDDIYAFETLDGWPEAMCVSCGDRLFHADIRQAMAYNAERMDSFLSPLLASADVVCDLGCGYGYHLEMLRRRFTGKRYWGCDLSANAVSLACKLFAGGQITVEQRNLLDPDFSVPFAKEEKVLILTVLTLEQLQCSKPLLHRLIENKGNSWQVCHFEPVFQWCGDDLLGMLRRAYTLANDYNRDFFPALQSHPSVRILRTEKEYFGSNPMHPMSFVHWQ